MNEDIKEQANIKPGPRKIFYIIIGNYELINYSLQKNYWNTEDVDDKIITMEELKEALKIKQKMENHPAKIIRIPNFINMQETHFMTDHVFFNNISIMGEMQEEWKNSTVVPIYMKGYKKNM
jgi:hypothetical protein